MKRGCAIAAFAAILIASWAGLRTHADARAQAALVRIEETLPAGTGFEWAGITADLLSGGARLDDVTFTLEGGHELHAETVEIGVISGDAGTQLVERLVAKQVTLTPRNADKPVRLLVARLEARDLRAGSLSRILDGSAAWPEFTIVDLEDIELVNDVGTFLTAARGRIGPAREGYVGRIVLDALTMPLATTQGQPNGLDLITMDKIEISELNFAPILALPERPTEEQVRHAIAETGDGRMAVSNLAGLRDGLRLLTVETIEVTTENGPDGINRQRLRAGDIVLADASFRPDGNSLLEEMGYRELRGTLDLDVVFDAPRRQLAFNSVELALHDAAALDVGFVLGSMPLSFASPFHGPTDEEVAHLTVERLHVTLRDASLVERLAGAIAARQGLDGDIYRQAQAASLRKRAAEMPSSDSQRLLNGLADFIETPGTLTLDAQPAMPLPLVALVNALMSDPIGALSKLEFDIRNN